MMDDLRPIQTRYAGCLFRSRLEARWAVLFDALELPWEYEAQGYALHSGPYLPDFWLPTLQAWFEVKGTEPPEGRERNLLEELAVASGARVFLAHGPIPDVVGEWATDSVEVYEGLYREVPGGFPADMRRGPAVSWDNQHAFCVCPSCGRVGLEYMGRGARICSRHAGYDIHGLDCDKGYTFDDPRVVEAYSKARTARFEHGVAGAP